MGHVTGTHRITRWDRLQPFFPVNSKLLGSNYPCASASLRSWDCRCGAMPSLEKYIFKDGIKEFVEQIEFVKHFYHGGRKCLLGS